MCVRKSSRDQQADVKPVVSSHSFYIELSFFPGGKKNKQKNKKKGSKFKY